MIKVSVIVPVYNVEEYIDQCINSLINQTLEDMEFIIVNDGSTDNSKKIIQKYRKIYPSKIIYLEKENGGLSDARNFGIPYAKGEYIAFLDSDDYVETDMYEEMYKKAKLENSDMVECDFYWEYPDRRKLDTGKTYSGKYEMIVNARVVAWNKLIKREMLKIADIQFPKGYRYEDVEFFYKLVPYIDKVSFIKKPFVHYIQRENSISNSQNEKTKEIFDILQHVIKYYKEKNIYETYKIELEYIYTRYLLCSSFLRIVKIKDKILKNRLLNDTWVNLNNMFPKWKENIILKREKNTKNLYLKTVNKITFKIYSYILGVIK